MMERTVEREYDVFRHMMVTDDLYPVFQPIIDFRARAIGAYELLIRGPQGSPWHLPQALFALADASAQRKSLEQHCARLGLQAFARQRLAGRLFINVSPDSLMDDPGHLDTFRGLLQALGIAPNRIVFELTENQQIVDLPGIRDVLKAYRGRGFRFAIDDLGEGFSNLRLWSELRPEFVKIDRHFVHGIADDRIKYHFVRAILDLAEICNAQLVAEGIERAEDFKCLRDMGIASGQGYFIAHPEMQPARQLTASVRSTLEERSLSLPAGAGALGSPPTAGTLLRTVLPLSPEQSNAEAVSRFEADAELEALPVVAQGRPIGMINRHSLIDRFARPFLRELYSRKSCELFMDHAPLIVDQQATLQELAMMLSLAPRHCLYDGFIITGEAGYLGIGSSHDLMARITEMQISAARYANPLTQLPGNVPINEHIDRLLAAGRQFVAAYIDIDHFKPFNDTFGYRRGDEVIQLLGQMLGDGVEVRQDFVGHIGGDDFFVVFQSPDWELRCSELLLNFAEAMASLVGSEERPNGGYMAENRRGEMCLHALPSLSIGAVRVFAGEYESHREVTVAAAAAKKQAKKKSRDVTHAPGGGSLFVGSRRALSVELTAQPGRRLN